MLASLLHEPARRVRQEDDAYEEHDRRNALRTERVAPAIRRVLQAIADPERDHDSARHCDLVEGHHHASPLGRRILRDEQRHHHRQEADAKASDDAPDEKDPQYTGRKGLHDTADEKDGRAHCEREAPTNTIREHRGGRRANEISRDENRDHRGFPPHVTFQVELVHEIVHHDNAADDADVVPKERAANPNEGADEENHRA